MDTQHRNQPYLQNKKKEALLLSYACIDHLSHIVSYASFGRGPSGIVVLIEEEEVENTVGEYERKGL